MSATTHASRQAATSTSTHTGPTEAPHAVCERVDVDRYAVLSDGTVGYIEVIPPLFICYVGHPYPKAVEVAQVFDFDLAVRRVLEHTAPPRTHRTAA